MHTATKIINNAGVKREIHIKNHEEVIHKKPFHKLN